MAPDLLKILVIDDEASMRHMLRLVLERHGYSVDEADSGESGLDALQSRDFDAVLCDIRMPGIDGLAFLEKASCVETTPTIIMMSAYGTIDTAITCMKRGAYDYISKPFKPDEIVLTLRKAEERLGLQKENRELKQALEEQAGQGLVYVSESMTAVMQLVDKMADARSPVLIHGETGTGKELVARALHDRSDRLGRPFVAVNCSAISPGLMESELFGHVRGAFTGAERRKEGLFVAAQGGTLFLDEIGELPLELQPKLLRVLQEGELRKVGDTRPQKIDVRVVTATAKDLKAEVEAGRFRDDLFYRLDVLQVQIPPLRERKEDIAPLVAHFLKQFCRRERRPVPRLTDAAMQALHRHDWPGNIRELRNFMEKLLVFCPGDTVDSDCLPWEVRSGEGGREGYSLKKAAARLEREYIRRALETTGGNRTRAARLLEISHRSLLYKIKEYGID